MILGLLISILTATYTVESSSSVAVSGEAPMNSTAVYSRTATTGQKGQMTAGNSTTLQLTGWDGYIIDSVVLSMHSNTSQGAGSLQIHIGKNMVWGIENDDFASKSWNGSFTKNWVDILCPIDAKVNSSDVIEIYIEASKNSLYINSYTIFYTPPAPKSHQVFLESGMSDGSVVLIEESIGSGVILPELCDTLEWIFLGWSENEIIESDVCPMLLLAGEYYYPKKDCTLWAVYADSDGLISTINCQSGDYVVASAYWNRALAGSVENKIIPTVSAEIKNYENGEYGLAVGARDNMVYHIDFMEDSTLYIKHVMTNKYIGYKDGNLCNDQSVWRYRVLSDGSFGLYYEDDALYRMLFVGLGKSEDVAAYAVRIELSSMRNNGVILFPAKKILFTSWPFGKLDGVENIVILPNEMNSHEHIMYFGNYVLRIKNGEKQLIVNK